MADSEASLRLLPEHVKSLARRAVALEQLGRREEALRDFAQVARVEPRNLQAVQGARRLREEIVREQGERGGLRGGVRSKGSSDIYVIIIHIIIIYYIYVILCI